MRTKTGRNRADADVIAAVAAGAAQFHMAVRANPALFDGLVVACGGAEWTGPPVLRLP